MTDWPAVSSGRKIRPSHITGLQDAVDGIQSGTLPIALPGIAGALGEYGPLANMRAGVVNVLDHHDGSDDYSDAIDAADMALGADGGVIQLPPGDIGISRNHQFRSGVNVVGRGSGSNVLTTHVIALHPSARFSFGERGSGNWGGASGEFVLDGNHISPQMLYIGRTLSRTISNIAVIYCAAGGSAVLVEEAQNNLFQCWEVNGNRGTGIEISRGAAGNLWVKPELTLNGVDGGYHVAFTGSESTPANLLAYPSNNGFYAAILERDGGALGAHIYHGAGVDNYFLDSTTANQSGETGNPHVLMEAVSNGPSVLSARLRLVNHGFAGNGAAATAMDIDDAASIVLDGQTMMRDLANGYRFRDTSSRVFAIGRIQYSSVTNRLHGSSVGTLDGCLYHPLSTPVLQSVPSGSTASLLQVDGESGARHRVNSIGTHQWGDGSGFSYDTVLSRGAANRLDLGAGDSLKVDGTWNGGTILLGGYRLWVDGSGLLRIKSSAPSSDTDGTVVGAQT